MLRNLWTKFLLHCNAPRILMNSFLWKYLAFTPKLFIKEVRVRIRTAREEVQRKCRGEIVSDILEVSNNREESNRIMTASTPDILLLG